MSEVCWWIRKSRCLLRFGCTLTSECLLWGIMPVSDGGLTWLISFIFTPSSQVIHYGTRAGRTLNGGWKLYSSLVSWRGFKAVSAAFHRRRAGRGAPRHGLSSSLMGQRAPGKHQLCKHFSPFVLAWGRKGMRNRWHYNLLDFFYWRRRLGVTNPIRMTSSASSLTWGMGGLRFKGKNGGENGDGKPGWNILVLPTWPWTARSVCEQRRSRPGAFQMYLTLWFPPTKHKGTSFWQNGMKMWCDFGFWIRIKVSLCG